jgi:hypothetical protein
MIEYEFKRQTQAYAGHDWVYLKLERESMLNMMVCVPCMMRKNERSVMMCHEQGD